ncbi:MAG: hypothetical protein A2Y63_04695, partial [Candidatus Riflebacteria bacterium RBG_13_59_9]
MTEQQTADRWAELLSPAREAASRAHAPFSGLHVGAAIRTTSGRTFLGCNIENASLGATICAERSALAAMVTAEGPEARIQAVAVWCSGQNPCYPCGICRQALLPFCTKKSLLIVET